MNLPKILRLLEQMQKRLDEAAINQKVVDDNQQIDVSFGEEDEELLRAIFNNGRVREPAKTDSV